MTDQVLLYISAASDLKAERDILGRAVAQVPVSLGWRIVQSPIGDKPVDLDAVSQADVHLLLLGGDVRAPVGQEWIAARRAGRLPVCFLKSDILRTPAAQNFARYIEEQAAWQPFRDTSELRSRTLRYLTNHLLGRAGHYALMPVELANLQAWRAELEDSGPAAGEDMRGGAGESGVVLSPERYIPSEGILIQGNQKDR